MSYHSFQGSQLPLHAQHQPTLLFNNHSNGYHNGGGGGTMSSMGSRYGHATSMRAQYEQLGWEEVTPPGQDKREQQRQKRVSGLEAHQHASSSSSSTQQHQQKKLTPQKNSQQQQYTSKRTSNTMNAVPTTPPSHNKRTCAAANTKTGHFDAPPTVSSSSSSATVTAAPTAIPVVVQHKDSNNPSMLDKPYSVLGVLLAQQQQQQQALRSDRSHTANNGSPATSSLPPTERALLFNDGLQNGGGGGGGGTTPTPADLTTATPTHRHRSGTLVFSAGPTSSSSVTNEGKQNSIRIEETSAAGLTRATNATPNDCAGRATVTCSSSSPSSPLNASQSEGASPSTATTTMFMSPIVAQQLVEQVATLHQQQQQMLMIQQQQQQQQMQHHHHYRSSLPNTYTHRQMASSFASPPMNVSGTVGTGTPTAMCTPKRYRLRGSGLDAASNLSNGSFASAYTTNISTAAVSREGSKLDTPCGKINTSNMATVPHPTMTAKNVSPHTDQQAAVGPLCEPSTTSMTTGSLLLKFKLNRKELAAKTSLVTNQPILSPTTTANHKSGPSANTNTSSSSHRGSNNDSPTVAGETSNVSTPVTVCAANGAAAADATSRTNSNNNATFPLPLLDSSAAVPTCAPADYDHHATDGTPSASVNASVAAGGLSTPSPQQFSMPVYPHDEDEVKSTATADGVSECRTVAKKAQSHGDDGDHIIIPSCYTYNGKRHSSNLSSNASAAPSTAYGGGGGVGSRVPSLLQSPPPMAKQQQQHNAAAPTTTRSIINPPNWDDVFQME